MVGTQERFVADRIPVDISGLREEIENAYPEDTFWGELSMSQKLRRLIINGLEKAKEGQSDRPKTDENQ